MGESNHQLTDFHKSACGFVPSSGLLAVFAKTSITVAEGHTVLRSYSDLNKPVTLIFNL